MIKNKLIPFDQSNDLWTIEVGCFRKALVLELSYHLKGKIEKLNLYPGRTTELWRSTCFELFLKPTGSSSYFEFNFSPEKKWDVMAFNDYRNRKPDWEKPKAFSPKIQNQFLKDQFELKVSIDLSGLDILESAKCDLGLTAVLQTQTGEISYWALKHSHHKPDFHQSESFIVRV